MGSTIGHSNNQQDGYDTVCMDLYGHTLPEIVIASENGWLEDEIWFGMAYFQGRAVIFKEG